MRPATHELAYWINERELMRIRREEEKEPPRWKYGWSDDALMGTVRYCNVRREDDKVTRWLAVNWRPQHHAVWEILLARLINNVPTLEKLVGYFKYEDQLEQMRTLLRHLRRDGPIFGSAYTVSTNGHSMDKVDYIIDHVLEPAQRAFHRDWNKSIHCATGGLAGACLDLCQLNGVSTFMAGQIIADLKNTSGHPLQTAPDWADWAAPGPGSLRGLAAYFGHTVTPRMFDMHLRTCYDEVRPLLGEHVPFLHMQDFQNCLCEFSKFMRIKENGHARNRYRPQR